MKAVRALQMHSWSTHLKTKLCCIWPAALNRTRVIPENCTRCPLGGWSLIGPVLVPEAVLQTPAQPYTRAVSALLLNSVPPLQAHLSALLLPCGCLHCPAPLLRTMRSKQTLHLLVCWEQRAVKVPCAYQYTKTSSLPGTAAADCTTNLRTVQGQCRERQHKCAGQLQSLLALQATHTTLAYDQRMRCCAHRKHWQVQLSTYLTSG